jgi:glycosyltransferase involved in cell wall biosynthesis
MSTMETQHRCPVLDIVVPVHNEERALPATIERLSAHLATLPWSWRITIADNASTDATSAIARGLTEIHPGVRLVSLPLKGRGRALKQVWIHSDADVLVYMDVDLSTGLHALLPLVAPLISGHSDIAIGSRLGHGSRVTRGPKRELVSRSYNALLKTTLHTGFSDAQCGFKAIRRDVAAALLPLVMDDDWFFDTELLVLAERAGLRIHEVHVDWVDDLDSRVNVLQTATDDLRGVGRLAWSFITGREDLSQVRQQIGHARNDGRASVQLILFVAIGIFSTVAYSLIYLVLRQSFSDQASNALALLATTIANTAANRRITFGVRGPGAWRHQAQGLAVLGLGLGLTSSTLWTLGVLAAGRPHMAFEVLAVTAANLVATAARFLAMRTWIFRPRSSDPTRCPSTIGAVVHDRVASTARG